MKKVLRPLGGCVIAASLMVIAGSASASTVLTSSMGDLDANKSLSDSVVLTYTPATKSKPSTLVYSFGAGPSTTLTGLTSGAVDLNFDFSIVGKALTLVFADAINPDSVNKALGGSPYIYLYDITTSTAVTSNAPFSAITIPKGYGAVTDALTLPPGSYDETVIGTLAKGTTDINVGAFAGAAVPEPATWAMMLIGVGMIGGGLRRKSRMAFAAA
jgi:PEP-CTERM motif